MKSHPEIQASIENLVGVSCKGKNDGQAEVVISPRGAELYSIGNSSLSQSNNYRVTVNALIQGPQIVGITDQSTKCIATVPFEVPYSGPVISVEQTAPALCDPASGAPTGALKATVSNGRYTNPTFTTDLYLLPAHTLAGTKNTSPGSFTGLSRGQYEVKSTVSSTGGTCTVSQKATLQSKTLFLNLADATDGCHNAEVEAQASANLYNPVSGFEAPAGAIFTWTSEDGTTRTGNPVKLSPGIYKVTAKAEGCQANGEIKVIDLPQPELNLYTKGVSCSGNNDGWLTLAA